MTLVHHIADAIYTPHTHSYGHTTLNTLKFKYTALLSSQFSTQLHYSVHTLIENIKQNVYSLLSRLIALKLNDGQSLTCTTRNHANALNLQSSSQVATFLLTTQPQQPILNSLPSHLALKSQASRVKNTRHTHIHNQPLDGNLILPTGSTTTTYGSTAPHLHITKFLQALSKSDK